MRCSASGMFATDNVNSCTCVIRKSMFSLMTRIALSLNPIVKSIVGGDVDTLYMYVYILSEIKLYYYYYY